MSYSPRPDASGDTLVSSRDPIRTNFTVLQSRFDENHMDLDAGVGGGKHKFLQLPEVLQANIPAIAANEGGLYTKVATLAPTETNLFFRAESNGNEYQLTHVVASATTEFATNTNYLGTDNGGWTFLPGGLIMQYGRKTSPTGTGTVTFPLVFPSGNAPFSIIITNEQGTAASATVQNGTATATSFVYFLGSGNSAVAINWIAIGN